jgi:RNA polymerase sigma factor (sigma-70 family)
MAALDSQPDQHELHSGAAPFANTHWSIVLAAANKENPSRALESLEALCRIYWNPLYAYARRDGATPHDAQDLTQEFFARLLEKDYLASVDKSKGRFRSFLLAAFKHFISNERDKARAQKRGGGIVPISIDAQTAETRCSHEPAQVMTADKIFERQWALALLEQTTTRLRDEYEADGKLRLFDELKVTLTEPRGSVAYATLAANLGMSEGAVKVAVHRLRVRYREVLWAEVAATLADPADTEDELKLIFAALSA